MNAVTLPSPLFDSLTLFDDLEPHPATLNMALDEALVERVRTPVLRFYRWLQPAVSFGYFGKMADVEPYRSGRDLVRRSTGGGIVLHGADVTYSITIPAAHALAGVPSRELYASIHEALRDTISDGERSASLAVENWAPSEPELADAQACFANPARADVLLDGRKIAGAAQRRTRFGLLHQGSVQYEELPDDFRVRFAQSLTHDLRPTDLTKLVLARAETLAAQKYATTEWLLRR